VNAVEIVELLAAIFPDKRKELENGNYDDWEQLVYDEWDVTLDNFEKIIDKLMPFASFWSSPITDQRYQGFVDHENGFSLVKEER